MRRKPKSPWSALEVPFECPSFLWVPKWSLRALAVKEVSSSTGNDLLNNLIKFFKISSEYILHIMFTDIIIHMFVKYSARFQKIKYDGLQNYSCSVQFCYCSWNLRRYFCWLFSIACRTFHVNEKYFALLSQLWNNHFWQKKKCFIAYLIL